VFSPDGSDLLACVGLRILVYHVKTGELLHSLRGHSDTIYSISYSPDGTQFASGGADKTVILWSTVKRREQSDQEEEGSNASSAKRSYKGVAKYSHDSSVQRVVFNPKGDHVASTTNDDVGFFDVATKQLNKFPTATKTVAATWLRSRSPLTSVNDETDEILAVGLVNGFVSFRNTKGHETVSIRRAAPISCLLWAPAPSGRLNSNSQEDMLVVGCWDKSISLYSLDGQRVVQDCVLDSTPLSLVHFGHANSNCILAAGTAGTVTLCSLEGIVLQTIYKNKPRSWIWSVAHHPESGLIAIGDHDHNVIITKLTPQSLPSAFCDPIYVSSPNLTSVVVEHLPSRKRIVINTKHTHVEAVCASQRAIAFATAGTVFVYTSRWNDNNDKTAIHPEEEVGRSTKVQDSFRCDYQCRIKNVGDSVSHLAMASENCILVARGRRLRLYSVTDGQLIGKWYMDEAPVSAISVLEEEDEASFDIESGKRNCIFSFLVGLENGHVVQVGDGNGTPALRFEVPDKVSKLCVDAAANNVVGVHTPRDFILLDMATFDEIHYEQGVTSVKFHANQVAVRGMAAYVKNGSLLIRHGPATIFCSGDFAQDVNLLSLQGNTLVYGRTFHPETVFEEHVSYDKLLEAHIASGDFERAHEVGTLMNTKDVWHDIVFACLLGGTTPAHKKQHYSPRFDIARGCLTSVKPEPDRVEELLRIIDQTEQDMSNIDSYSIGEIERQQFVIVCVACGEIATKLEYPANKAAAFFLQANKPQKAIGVYVKAKLWDEAKDAAHQFGLSPASILEAQRLAKSSQDQQEGRGGDLHQSSTIDSNDNGSNIDRAMSTADDLQNMDKLESQGKRAAQKKEFRAAAYYFYHLEKARTASSSQPSQPTTSKRQYFLLYHAYQHVHAYCQVHSTISTKTRMEKKKDSDEKSNNDVMLRCCLFLLNSLVSFPFLPSAMSRRDILYTLAKVSSVLGQFELAYSSLSMLQSEVSKATYIKVNNEVNATMKPKVSAEHVTRRAYQGRGGCGREPSRRRIWRSI
jgi:hypothetical protein